MLHQFLTYGNRNIWDLNRDYKHLTEFVEVLKAYRVERPQKPPARFIYPISVSLLRKL